VDISFCLTERKIDLFCSIALPLLMLGQDAYDRYTFFSIKIVPTASSAGFEVIPTFSVYCAAHKIDVGAHIKVSDVSEDRFGIMGGGITQPT
jgi:hypothetical protein